MNKGVNQYLDLLKELVEKGSKRMDRTGVGTSALFGRQIRFDLSEGFPLLTTKKMHLKGIIAELLWFLSGDTNVKTLRDQGVHIWDEWSTEEHCATQGRAPGDIGPMYGNAWREWTANYVVKIPPRIRDVEPAIEYPLWVLEDPDLPGRSNSPVGRIHTNHQGLQFRVLRGYKVDQSRDVYDVQFLTTGWVRREVPSSALKDGSHLKDKFHPSIFGVACVGETDKAFDDLERGLYQGWFAMIRRCYDPQHPGYHCYGGKGVFVCNRWLVFSNFLADAPKIRGWRERRLNPTGVQLDKDFYSSNCYSPETCVWLPAALNTAYTGTAIEATLSGGEKRMYLTAREASRELQISTPSIRKSVKTGRTSCGVLFRELEGPYRLVTMVDQLAWVIDELKKNPFSRRLVVTAWNPANSHKVALETCHCLFQFFVEEAHPAYRAGLLFENGTDEQWFKYRSFQRDDVRDLFLTECGIPRLRLSCQLYQRSCDFLLGGPYNIASYSLLTMMVAQCVDMIPGDFVHTFGDVHLYNNHVDQAAEQLSRSPYPFPTMCINREVKDIFSFVLADFTLADYESWPAIKAPVAV